MKTCTNCGKSKALSSFNKSNKTRDGRREQCRSCEKEYRDTPEVKQRRYERDLLKKYNLTLQGYNKLFNKQQGCCKICSTHQASLDRPLVVDHCHSTGKIRGLLCDSCNRGLGFLGDTKESLKRAYEYLANV